MLKIMLVDDQVYVREGLKMRLSLEPDVSIVGEASDGVSAVKTALSLKPDLIIMDLEMNGNNLDGVAATQAIKASLPPVTIVILTIHDDKIQREKALKAGAEIFLAKNRLEDLLGIIRKKVQIQIKKEGEQT
jgi:two-component system response regulator NreC